MFGKLMELRKAAEELAGLASYAEITGGVRVNRPGIRKWCDEVYRIKHEIEEMEEVAYLEDDPRARAIDKIKAYLTDEERVALFGDQDLKWVNG
jgi:hypothetical protein